MFGEQKIENDSVLAGEVKAVLGRENILFHVVLQVDMHTIREAKNPTLSSLDDVIALAKSIDTRKPEHTYYSIYDEDGRMVKSNFPFIEGRDE